MAVIKLEDLEKPLLALSGDVDRAEREMVGSEDSYARRNHIRALSAMIEGTIYILKRTVIIATSSGPGPFSIAELALLKEENFDLTDKGAPRVRKSYPRTIENLLFTKSCLEKAFGYSLDLNATPSNWKNFKDVNSIRNRRLIRKSLTISKFQTKSLNSRVECISGSVGSWLIGIVSSLRPILSWTQVKRH